MASARSPLAERLAEIAPALDALVFRFNHRYLVRFSSFALFQVPLAVAETLRSEVLLDRFEHELEWCRIDGGNAVKRSAH